MNPLIFKFFLIETQIPLKSLLLNLLIKILKEKNKLSSATKKNVKVRKKRHFAVSVENWVNL